MSTSPNSATHGLNAPQRDAIKYMDGPCLVLAGAGSGKTRVITTKIASLIEEHGYEAKNIAALTFTNKAALEMQERIAKLLKEPKQAKQLTVSTFHSLGVKILRQEAKELGLKDRFSIMDSDDCFSLVQDLAVTTDKQLIRRIQTAMSLWKNGLIDPDTALNQARDEDEAQAARIYRSYVATLSAYQAVDFDDLIRLPVELFRTNETVRDKWQRRLRYLLVDEYQDTNTCQYELVKLLVTGVGKKPMFTAVGDDDQAIYAWRGATIENLKQLQVDFPDLKIVKLEQNYRSSTRILQAANSVISNNPKLFEKSLWSEHGLGDPVKVMGMQDDDQEAEQIAIMLSAHRFERRQILRLRDPVPRQPPGARHRTGAAQGTYSVHDLRRSKFFRPRRDQGHHQLFAPDREPGRRPCIHPRGHHAEAWCRAIDAGSPGCLRRAVAMFTLRGGLQGRAGIEAGRSPADAFA